MSDDLSQMSTTDLLARMEKQKQQIEDLEGTLADAQAEGKRLADAFMTKQAELLSSLGVSEPTAKKTRKKASGTDGRGAPKVVIHRVISRVLSTAKKNKVSKTEAKDMATAKLNEMIAAKNENAADYKTTVAEIMKKYYPK